MFSAQKSKCPRGFPEIDADCMHTCSMSPCQAVDDDVFSVGSFGYPKTKHPKKYKKKHTRYLATKNEKEKAFGNGLAGVHRTRVPNFRVYPPKTAWILDASLEIWGDMLEAAGSHRANFDMYVVRVGVVRDPPLRPLACCCVSSLGVAWRGLAWCGDGGASTSLLGGT